MFSQHPLKKSAGAQQIETQTPNLFTFPSSSEAGIAGGQDSNKQGLRTGLGSRLSAAAQREELLLVPSVHSSEEKDTN